MFGLRFLFVVLLVGAEFGLAGPRALAAAATSSQSNYANGLGQTSNVILGVADAPPTYLLVFPQHGFVGVPTHTRPSVEFNEPVTAGSGAFSLECPTGTAIPHTVRSTNQRRWSLEPDADLPFDTVCALHVDAQAVQDIDGVPQSPAADLDVQFTTSAERSGYYANVDASSCRALRATLHGVIEDHFAIPYHDGDESWDASDPASHDVWELIDRADEDPIDTGKVLDLYRNESYLKASGGVAYVPSHIWPHQHGFNSLSVLDGSPNAPYTDVHALMAADVSYAAHRGDRLFRQCNPASPPLQETCSRDDTIANLSNGAGGGPLEYSAGTTPGHNWFSSGADGSAGVYEVWGFRRGDAARAMLYMDVRYEGGTHRDTSQREPDLRLRQAPFSLSHTTTPGEFISLAYSAELSTLLQWVQSDPPTSSELLRNDIVQSVQGNRNPFVDHPEWIPLAFAQPCDGPQLVSVDDDYDVPQDGQLTVFSPGVLQNDHNGTYKNGQSMGVLVVDAPRFGNLELSGVGAFRYTPAAGFCGDDRFTYLATDADFNFYHFAVVTLRARPPSGVCNLPPVAEDSTFTLPENSAAATVVGQVVASDADVGTALLHSITAGNDDGAFAISALGEITVADAGPLDYETTPQFVLTVPVSDGSLSDTATITIELSNVNEAPVIAEPLAERSGDEDVAIVPFSVADGFTDPDAGTDLGYSQAGLPPGLALDPETGEISGVPAPGSAAGSPYTVVITASDGALSVQQSFQFTVGVRADAVFSHGFEGN